MIDDKMAWSERNRLGNTKDFAQNTAIIVIHALMTRVQRLGNILYSSAVMILIT
jgi:hypothetical protein